MKKGKNLGTIMGTTPELLCNQTFGCSNVVIKAGHISKETPFSITDATIDKNFLEVCCIHVLVLVRLNLPVGI